MRYTILLLLMLPLLLASQDKKLTLVSDVWPPFTNVEDQQSVATDIVQEALNRADVKSDIKIVDGFKEVLDGIKKGTYDGSAALWLDTDRQQYVLFSKPFMKNQLLLVARKGTEVENITREMLKGKKVGVVEGYSYGAMVKQKLKIKWVKGRTDQENLTGLLQGKMDYMLVDGLLIQYLLTYQPEEVEEYLSIGEVLFQRGLYFGMRKNHPDAEEIVSKFNEEIPGMMKDGTFNELLNVNWVESDVDGDGITELVARDASVGAFAPALPYSVWFEDEDQNRPTQRYYIKGEIYQGWDTVPAQYKVAQKDKQDFTILDFGF